MEIKFIDLYSDNPFDPAKLIAEGYIGVVFKAGQGAWADIPRYCSDWWELARQYSLKRGWYWLCDSRHKSADHITEMKKFHIFESVGELGLWVDIEKPVISMTERDYWKTQFAGYKNLIDFCYLITQEKVTPGIYTGPGAYELVMRGAPKTAHDYLSQFKLWTAQYPWIYVPGISKPSLYGSWKKWTWWQYREGPDVNLYNGTLDQFEAEYVGGVVLPPEPPQITPTGDTSMSVTVKGTAKTALNIKKVSGGGAIATLPIGGYVYGVLSVGGTDITGFEHYYKASGQLIPLTDKCKVTAAPSGMVIVEAVEPGTTPPPEQPPTPDDDSPLVKMRVYRADDTYDEYMLK
jgi:hypothetical protein